MQTDSELSEIFLRAFILRRLALMARGAGQRRAHRLAPLGGHAHAAGVPDPEQPALRLRRRGRGRRGPGDARRLRRQRRRRARLHLPRQARPQEADHRGGGSCLGLEPGERGSRATTSSSSAPAPPGSAAAVYAASEGLDVLVLESSAPGGQAGSSSRIENYLGFPTGISGQRLAGLALRAGGEVRRASSRSRAPRCASPASRPSCASTSAAASRCRRAPSSSPPACEYRKPDLPNLDALRRPRRLLRGHAGGGATRAGVKT